jgi:hypothetical protein
MLVSREDQSAEWIAEGEDSRFYDDIGCLATDPWSAPGRSTRFVHVGRSWSPAETAFYGRPSSPSTPMGYGVAAFATWEEAASLDREGRARTWQELVQELRHPVPGAGGRASSPGDPGIPGSPAISR